MAFRLNQKTEIRYFTAKVEQGDIRQVIGQSGDFGDRDQPQAVSGGSSASASAPAKCPSESDRSEGKPCQRRGHAETEQLDYERARSLVPVMSQPQLGEGHL